MHFIKSHTILIVCILNQSMDYENNIYILKAVTIKLKTFEFKKQFYIMPIIM